MSADQSSKLYAFKDFTIDIGETVLLRRGKSVPITPKAFHLLSILVQHPGSVVEKEKLISEIWSDSIVEEGNLAFTAQLLRKALGDDAKTPIYIETVPRRGYRFIAEVSPVTTSADDVTAVPVPRRTGRFRAAILGIAFVVIAVASTSVAWYLLRGSAVPNGSTRILEEPFKAERLSSTGNAVQAAISPNGKHIAYLDQTGNGKWSVWLRDVVSSENVQILAPAELRYGSLVFSRDSNSLFMTRGSTRLDIYRVNIFGGVPTKLVEDTQGWISVSHDDKRISYVRCEYAAGDCSLFISDIDGRNERRMVTRAQPMRIGDNAFSPDGRSVVFAAGQSRTGSDAFQLFQFDVTSGAESPISSERFFDIKALEWLPGGSELLITARTPAQHNFNIWTVSVATGAVAQLTRDDANFSALSLDSSGEHLVVTKVDNNFTIFVGDVAAPNKRRSLTPGPNCVFAPDGRIVFESNDRDIWIIDADGNNKRQLTSDSAADVNPIVTADGKQIVFSSNRSGLNHLWRMNIDGSDQRQLTHREGGHSNYVTPDGSTVYYTTDITRAFRKVDVATGVESDLPAIVGEQTAFSPDGNLVASFDRDSGSNESLAIRVQDMSGQTAVRLFVVGENSLQPIDLEWSADGTSLNYVARRSEEYELWSVDLRTERHSLVSKLGSEPLHRVILSPDRKSLAAVHGSWRHDAFLVTGLKF